MSGTGATGSGAAGTLAGGQEAAPLALPAVTDMVRLFARAVRAHQLYLPNNPMHARALEAVRDSFASIWRELNSLDLVVTESQFLYDEHVVLEEQGRGSESLPWLFYKDGIRVLELGPGFEGADLNSLLDIVQAVRTQTSNDDDDLLTMFWEHDFTSFSYRFVEVATDTTSAPGAELLLGGAPTGTIEPPATLEQGEPATYAAGNAADQKFVSPFARIEDFDTTLYFLDDREIQYLQDAIRDDYNVDLRPSVIAALLDTFEQEDAPEIRDEICGILEQFLLTLLSNMQFQTVAYLLRESRAAVDRSASLTPSHQERLSQLASRLSDANVLQQLLQSLEESPLFAPEHELEELFAQLQAPALETVLSQLALSRNAGLRPLLEQSATRIAASNTAELIRLIDSSNEAVSFEAVRRAGALRSPAAVAPLARALTSPNVDIRRSAVEALSDIGSAGAMQALERAVDDDDRDVRVAAVKALADRHHRAALGRVEKALKDRVLQDPHGPEKAAFLEAYAALAGDGSIPLLDGLLNPRGFLSKKPDTQTRAYAAAALGKVGSTAALDALRKATNDKDVVVRNAASRALRGGGS